jgi:predicted glutamine amidotransferase
MLIASGNVDLAKLFNGIIKMSRDETKKHEFNRNDREFLHSDGWGIAYLDNKNNWIMHKSTGPIFMDPKIKQLQKVKTRLAIIHARRATQGTNKPENTHPFIYNDYKRGKFVFCHNGSMKGDIHFSAKYQLQGKTDSEKLFYAVLTELENNDPFTSMKNVLRRNNDCKGTNLIFVTPNKSYVTVKENLRPKYYQMQLGTSKDLVVVSSEKLTSLSDLRWQALNPGSFVEIENKKADYKLKKNIKFTPSDKIKSLGSSPD